MKKLLNSKYVLRFQLININHNGERISDLSQHREDVVSALCNFLPTSTRPHIYRHSTNKNRRLNMQHNNILLLNV